MSVSQRGGVPITACSPFRNSFPFALANIAHKLGWSSLLKSAHSKPPTGIKNGWRFLLFLARLDTLTSLLLECLIWENFAQSNYFTRRRGLNMSFVGLIFIFPDVDPSNIPKPPRGSNMWLADWYDNWSRKSITIQTKAKSNLNKDQPSTLRFKAHRTRR